MSTPAKQPVSDARSKTKPEAHSPAGRVHARYLRSSITYYMAFRNMMYKKLRSTLTIGGVVIGIGAIVFLVSLGLGLQKVVTEQIINSSSVKTIDVSSPKPKVARLDDVALQKLRGLANVEDVAVSYSYAGKATFQSANVDVVINGVDQRYLQLSAFKRVAGETMKFQDSQRLIVNESFAQTIGLSDASKLIGQRLSVKVARLETSGEPTEFTQDLIVAGVVKTGSGSEVFIPASLFQEANARDYKQVRIMAKDQESVPEIRKSVDSLGFNSSSPIDTLAQINQVFAILNVVLAGFGSIGMVIAILGMINTLTISLLERTKEIGLLVSLGARHKDVRRLFLIESLLLSVIGGVVGILAAWFLGRGLNIVIANVAKQQGIVDQFSFFYIPFWLVASTIAFTATIGFLVAFFPARRASRISPIDALRHE